MLVIAVRLCSRFTSLRNDLTGNSPLLAPRVFQISIYVLYPPLFAYSKRALLSVCFTHRDLIVVSAICSQCALPTVI